MAPRYNHIPENWSFRLFQTTSNNGKHHCQRLPFSLDFWFSWSNSVPLRINTSNNHFPHPRSCLLLIYNIPSSEPIVLSLKLGFMGSHFTSLHHPKEMESIFCEQIVYSRAPHDTPPIPNTSLWSPNRKLFNSPWTDDSCWGLINTKFQQDHLGTFYKPSLNLRSFLSEHICSYSLSSQSAKPNVPYPRNVQLDFWTQTHNFAFRPLTCLYFLLTQTFQSFKVLFETCFFSQYINYSF